MSMLQGLLSSWSSRLPLADAGGDFWFPKAASTMAPDVDELFYLILWICTFFFVLIVGLMVYFVWKYRRRPGHEVQPSASHNTPLEVAWSVLPGLILLVIFGQGFIGFLNMRQPQDNAYEIIVNAQKWSWAFQYPGGFVSSELHVPSDRPVKLVMASSDVLHSLFVPAFRVKMDIIPGRYSHLWFQATEPGEYNLFCAEYCGQQHSTMVTKTIVYAPGEFENWLREAEEKMLDMPPVELGELLYTQQGCFQCHAMDDTTSGKAGPTFYRTFGTEQPMADGSTVVVDENYIRESILEPNAKVRAGFQPVMPSFKGRIDDRRIDALIAYIKSLNGVVDEAPPAAAEQPETTEGAAAP